MFLSDPENFYLTQTKFTNCGPHSPLTCCSRLRMTATAWCSMSSLVWGLSLFRWSCTMRPSSLKASLMSRTRSRSRALLAILRSRSRSIFCSGVRSSSSLLLVGREASGRAVRTDRQAERQTDRHELHVLCTVRDAYFHRWD